MSETDPGYQAVRSREGFATATLVLVLGLLGVGGCWHVFSWVVERSLP